MKKSIFYFAIFCFSFFKSEAITYTFEGKYSADWNNALNWKSPQGKPSNVILKYHKIIIEATCVIPQGITITNYGNLIVKQTCTRFDYSEFKNYGTVVFEQEYCYQNIGTTFTNYKNGIVILAPNSILPFCHLKNEGQILNPNSVKTLIAQKGICD